MLRNTWQYGPCTTGNGKSVAEQEERLDISLICLLSASLTPPPTLLSILFMSEAILCPPQGPITNKAGVWAQGTAGRGCLRLSLPYCRFLWRSNTLTVAWSNAPMQKHINTCGWCDQPPVHRMDAHTHTCHGH